MTDAVGADLRASQGSPKGLAPLHIGAADNTPLLTAELHTYEKSGEHAMIELHFPGRVGLSKPTAAKLGRWLLDWSRPRAKLKLWGIDGIAKECKVSRRTAYNWAAKEGFPPPLDVVGGNGPVWEADAVKAWVRLVHRPGKQKARG